MTAQVLLHAGAPAFDVDYPASFSPFSSGFTACGNVPAQQIGAPFYENGSGSYSYSGAWVSGGSGITVSGSTSERPTFGGVACDGAELTGTYRMTVTDTATGAVAFDDIFISVIWVNLS